MSKSEEITNAPLNGEERNYLAKVAMAEARGGGIVGMVAVLQTVKDRAYLYGISPLDVVKAPRQYCRPYEGPITAEAMLAVEYVFDKEVRAFIACTTHFHSVKSKTPYWAKNFEYRGEIGGNKFYE